MLTSSGCSSVFDGQERCLFYLTLGTNANILQVSFLKMKLFLSPEEEDGKCSHTKDFILETEQMVPGTAEELL